MAKNSHARRHQIFISRAAEEELSRKAAFQRTVLNLLSKRPEQFVATLDADRVADAFVAYASSAREVEDSEQSGIDHPDAGNGTCNTLNDRALPSGLARKSARSAPVSTRATTIEGAHNIEALTAGRELVETAAKRPTCGAWQMLSGKGGSGKTTMLLHLAILAQEEHNLNVAVIDFGASQTAMVEGYGIAGLADADLVLVDNAHGSPPRSSEIDWWKEFNRQVSKSACVLVAVTPDAHGAHEAPWRQCSDTWRDTSIGAFDCEFRRALIGDLSRRHTAEHGGAQLSDAAVGRLAEELWGDGWQLAEGVAACSAYATVMAREPRPDEIDDIARNLAASSPRYLFTPIWYEIQRDLNLASQTEDKQRDAALYAAKKITGQSLEQIARDLELGREAAVHAIRRMECRAREDDAIRRVIDTKVDEFEARVAQIDWRQL